MAERPLWCGSETSSLQHTQSFICPAGEGLAGASLGPGKGWLFTHNINQQPTVGMRKSASDSLPMSTSQQRCGGFGCPWASAAVGKSGMKRRLRGHMKELLKGLGLSSLRPKRTIECSLSFLYIILWCLFGVWKHFLSPFPVVCLQFVRSSESQNQRRAAGMWCDVRWRALQGDVSQVNRDLHGSELHMSFITSQQKHKYDVALLLFIFTLALKQSSQLARRWKWRSQPLSHFINSSGPLLVPSWHQKKHYRRQRSPTAPDLKKFSVMFLWSFTLGSDVSRWIPRG